MLDGSPSSRRAWIEILLLTESYGKTGHVALLAEGVDRNQWPDITVFDG